MATRSWPVPPVEGTLHCIGDFHAEGIPAQRAKIALDDLDHTLVPDIAQHLQLGDLGKATPAQDSRALAWLNQLPGKWWAVCGNHDLENDIRTPAQWAAAFGMPAPNYTVDLGYVQLIAVAPDSFAKQESLANALGYLDAELKRHYPKPCYIAAHFPLYDTVGGDPATDFVSTQGRTPTSSPFYAVPDHTIRQILAANPNAKAWICGHTHSRTTAPNFIKSEPVCDGRVIASINTSSIYYVGHRDPSQTYIDPIQTFYVTYQTQPERIEVRVRNHGAGVWAGFGAERVKEIIL